MSDADILKEAQEAFTEAAEREDGNRADALDDIRFARLEEQWPEAIRRQRELEGRPCLTINKLAPVIRQVVNDARQNRPAIKVLPQDSKSDPETAEIMSGLIRSIESASDADVAYDTAVEHAVTGGFGYFRINLAYSHDDSFEQDIVFERVGNPFSVYGDPYSTQADSSDWNTAFIVDRLSKDAFERKYKGAEKVDWESEGYAGLRDPWLDDEQVMVAEYWTREEAEREIVALSNGEIIDTETLEKNAELFTALGIEVVGQTRKVKSHKVKQRILNGAEVLETVDWAGKWIPIVPVYGDEVNVEGKRYFRSLIRSAKDAQRNFNYWNTMSTELVALAPKAPFIGRKGAFETDAAKWETANSQNHAYIEFDGQEAPQRQPFAGIPAGALQEALSASDHIKQVTGIYDASLGAPSNETSGRAINARQREGDVSTFHFIDNLTRAIRHGGRILIDLIPKVYTSDRVIRTLGPEGDPRAVPLGQPTQNAEGVERIYDLSSGRYDLSVTAGPSYTTRRQEAAEQMVQFIQAFPPAAPIMGDLLAKALDWPGAEEIGKRLQTLLPPPIQQMEGEGGPPQPDPMQMQAAQQQHEASMAQMQQQDAKNQADASLKAEELRIKEAEMVANANIENRKLDLDILRAQTERMIAQHTISQPTPGPRSDQAA